MSCNNPSMCFLLFPIAYLLIWHFCTCIPDKILCVCDLFWVGQFSSTYFLCPMILHIFWYFFINGLAGIIAAQKVLSLGVAEDSIDFSHHENLTSNCFWIFHLYNVRFLKCIGLCSLGASNFALSPSFSFSVVYIWFTTYLICQFLGLFQFASMYCGSHFYSTLTHI